MKIFLKKNQILLVILGFSLALRLVYFFGILEGDDLDYVFAAHFITKNGIESLGELANLIPGSNRPGLYLPPALFFNLFGVNEFVAVLFPLISSLLVCFFVYQIATMLGGRAAGWLAAFLWAVFPLDIFLATQLDPEGPLTMATTGAIYFLFVASSKRTRWAKFCFFSLSALFIYWGFLIKQSSLPILFVVFAWLALKYLPSKASIYVLISRLSQRTKIIAGASFLLFLTILSGFILRQQPWSLVINNAELSAYDITPAWILGRMNPIRAADTGGYYFQLNREPYTPIPQAHLLSENPKKDQFFSFDAYVPILLVAIFSLILSQKRKYYFPIIWFGILLFYLEWGIFPRSFTSYILLYYLPISHWISPDNFLYITVPMVLVIALFISENLTKTQVIRLVPVAIFIVLITVLLSEFLPTKQLSLNYISLALVLLAFFGFYGLLILSKNHRNKLSRNRIFSALVVLIGIAALNPAPHFHVSKHVYEQELRENLRAANSFLANQPSYPIYKGGPIERLDFYAGFTYGYSRYSDVSYPDIRLTSDLNIIREIGGYSVSENCGKPVTEFEEWPLIEFGDPGSPTCISLYKFIPQDAIDRTLALASEYASATPSFQTINEYLHAAANGEDFAAFVDAISQMVTFYPEIVPIVKASGLIQAYGLEQSQNSQIDLLESYFSGNLGIWRFGKFLEPSRLTENGDDILQIRIEKSTQEAQPFSVSLLLKSNTAYILEFEVLSFAPFDLVRFPELSIPDSHQDGWGRADSWTQYTVVFVTPTFSEERTEVFLELARVFDRGDIKFRRISLIEVVPIE
jgi:hypothetical protein